MFSNLWSKATCLCRLFPRTSFDVPNGWISLLFLTCSDHTGSQNLYIPLVRPATLVITSLQMVLGRTGIADRILQFDFM